MTKDMSQEEANLAVATALMRKTLNLEEQNRLLKQAHLQTLVVVEMLRAEVQRLRAELVIGSFILRSHDADHVWIGRPDGEGGAFAINKVEAALRAFYRENF